MKTLRLSLVICLMTIFSGTISARVYKLDKLMNKDFCDTINVEFVDNRIYMLVEVNEEVLRMMFDTGSSLFMLPDTLLKEGYENISQMFINDGDLRTGLVNVIAADSVTVGKLRYQKSTCALLPDSVFRNLGCEGIFGMNALRKHKVKIDMKNRRIIVSDRKDAFAEDKGEVLKMREIRNSAFIFINSYRDVQEDVLFDTGKPGMFYMSESHYKYYQKNHPIKKILVGKENKADELGIFSTGIVREHDVLKIPEIRIGEYPIRDVVTAPQPGSSRIGADILNKGVVILDYIKGKFIFSAY